jgi:hypothetical protein
VARRPAALDGRRMATGTISLATALGDACFQNNRGGRDNGGQDAEGGGGRFNLIGIRSNIPTSCFELSRGIKAVAAS